jgi:hypothetical protein
MDDFSQLTCAPASRNRRAVEMSNRHPCSEHGGARCQLMTIAELRRKSDPSYGSEYAPYYITDGVGTAFVLAV